MCIRDRAACIAGFEGLCAIDGRADAPELVLAAGGPERLLASLDAELRSRNVRLTRLTHPM